jgi:hypothetical protein
MDEPPTSAEGFVVAAGGDAFADALASGFGSDEHETAANPASATASILRFTC